MVCRPHPKADLRNDEIFEVSVSSSPPGLIVEFSRSPKFPGQLPVRTMP